MATVFVVAVALIIVVSVLVALLSGGTKPSDRSTTTLPPGGVIEPGRVVAGETDHFHLTMETNGNLATTMTGATVPSWQSATAGHPGAYAVMQSDGDLVIYPKGTSAPAPGQRSDALWDSGTTGHPGSRATLQDDGNLVIVGPTQKKILWDSGPAPKPGSVGSQLLAGESLAAGQYLESPDGLFRLLDDPTSLSIRFIATAQQTCAQWIVPDPLRRRQPSSASSLQMQVDGNLVAYRTATAIPLWNTDTSGNPGASLVLQDGGNLVILSTLGETLWHPPITPHETSRCGGGRSG